MSELVVFPDRQADFLEALLNKLAGPETKAAFWFYKPVELLLTAEPLTGASPFPASGAVLAGDGYLAELTADSYQLTAVSSRTARHGGSLL